jgi:hypothetical protein
MISTRRIAMAAIFTAAAATTARAQCRPGGPPSPPMERRALVGIVMDSLHEPLADVEVLIRAPRRQVRTNARGVFKLGGLEPGTYEVTVRRIGYELALQKYVITDSGGVARFCLVAEPRGLAPMVTSVLRGGLSGVVADTAMALVPGAEVRVMGEGLWAVTDSAGEFYIPAEKGTYAVVVTKNGYGQALLSVSIPTDSGRRIAVWLGSRHRNPNSMKLAIDGIRQRIMRTPAHRYKMVTSEDLARSNLSVAQVAQVAARTGVPDDCEAGIGGEQYSLPLYMIDKSEIAMMEIIGQPLRRTRVGRCPGLIVWLKP